MPAVAGALAVVLGLLALLAALWRAGAAPRWLLVAVAVVALSGAAPLPGGLVPVRGALDCAALPALAWCALRAGRTGGRVEVR